MTDPRLLPFNGRVALRTLEGQVAAERFVDGDRARVTAPLADLRATPDGPRIRQWLRGARVRVIERRAGIAFAQAEADGLVGWLEAVALGPDHPVTHAVPAPATHLYTAPDLKSPDLAALSCGARLRITGTEGAFLRCADGFVPAQHVARLDIPAADPVAVAAGLLGTPYLWGGNARAGIDCSGLVQVACHLCAIPCPPDSDLQRAGLGAPLDPDAARRRGDLAFWPGHVGWLTDADTLLHANAHHMAVVQEPLADAIARMGVPAALRRL